MELRALDDLPINRVIEAWDIARPLVETRLVTRAFEALSALDNTVTVNTQTGRAGIKRGPAPQIGYTRDGKGSRIRRWYGHGARCPGRNSGKPHPPQAQAPPAQLQFRARIYTYTYT